MNHPTARQVILQAFELELGRQPVAWEAQVVQVISWHESNYGAGWAPVVAKGIADPEAATSNNWGAVQYGPPPPTPGKSFGTRDTHRDGSPYTFTYKIYPTPVDGARDVIRILERRKVLGLARNAACTTWVIAQNIIRSGYSEGSGKTEEDAIRNYWETIKPKFTTVATGVGERRMPDGGGGESPLWFREPGPDPKPKESDRTGPASGAGGAAVDLEALAAAVASARGAQGELAAMVAQIGSKLDTMIARVEAGITRALDIAEQQIVNTTKVEQLEQRVDVLEHEVAILKSQPPRAAE